MIGAGWLADRSPCQFRPDPGCRVTALAELRPGLGKAAIEKFGVPQLFGAHIEMLAADVIDAAVVVTRRLPPVSVVRMCSTREHVLSEKPMAHTTEQAARLVKAATDKKLFIQSAL